MERLLTYGLQNGVLKHVDEVKNGLACNCKCACCGKDLVAKNNPGNKKVSHFAHHHSIECAGAYESALHLLAKSILLKRKQMRLPDFHHDYDPCNYSSFFSKGRQIIFDEVLPDGNRMIVDDNHFIPDSVGIYKGMEVLIEFAFTHFIDKDKLELIRRYGAPCVQIDLRNQQLDEATLTAFLDSEDEAIRWVYNPRKERAWKAYRLQMERLKREEEDNQRRQSAERQGKINQYFKDQFKRYKRYQEEGNCTLFIIPEAGKVLKCPKKTLALSTFKESELYKHSVLKRIIDGEYWNEQFYGHEPNGCWIFLNGEKIYIYRPLSRDEILPSNEEYQSNFFYSGLKQIIAAVENFDLDIGNCGLCDYNKDIIKLPDREYSVCTLTMT